MSERDRMRIAAAGPRFRVRSPAGGRGIKV